MTLVKAETLSLIAWCRSQGCRGGRASVAAAPPDAEGFEVSSRTSPPTAPRLQYCLGDIRVVAGLIPSGVSINPTDLDLCLTGVDSSSMSSSAAPQPILFDRTDRPGLLLLDRSIRCRFNSRATACLGRAPINIGLFSSMDCDKSILLC